MIRYATHSSLALIFRAVIASIFIYASLHKINFPLEFADNIAAYQLVPYWLVNPLAILLPWVELVGGTALAAGVRVRAASIIVGVLLLLFTVAVVTALLRDIPIGCGCFQNIGDPISWWTVLRDIGWLLMITHVYRYDTLVHLDRIFLVKPEELGL